MLFLSVAVTIENDPFKQAAAYHKRVLTSLFFIWIFTLMNIRVNHQFHMTYHPANSRLLFSSYLGNLLVWCCTWPCSSLRNFLIHHCYKLQTTNISFFENLAVLRPLQSAAEINLTSIGYFTFLHRMAPALWSMSVWSMGISNM